MGVVLIKPRLVSMLHWRRSHGTQGTDRRCPGVSEIYDSWCGSKVFLQVDDVRILCFRKFGPHLANYFYLCASEPVYGLTMITNNCKSSALAGYELNELALHGIYVLDLIDNKMHILIRQPSHADLIAMKTTNELALRSAEVEKAPTPQVRVVARGRLGERRGHRRVADIRRKPRLLAPAPFCGS